MKKLKWVGVFFLIVCIVGCARQAEKNKEQKKTIKREEVVLWSYYETKEQQRSLEELVAGFNESQKQYKLVWEYHGPASEFSKKIAIGITQKQLPDMVIIDNPDMRRYVEQEIFEDISKYVVQIKDLDTYYTNVLQSVVYDGKYYGFPFCCNNAGLIYNKDMFTEVGVSVPKTWEEFQEVAQKLSENGRYGFAMSAIEGEQSAFQILPWILSAGDTVEQLGNAGTREAFTLMEDLIKTKGLSRECINWSQNDVARVFIAGRCAMMENGPWVLPALNESEINYGIAKLPIKKEGISVTGGENLGVLKGKNIQGAMEFINYYSDDTIMLNVNLTANSIPPKKILAQQMLNVKPEYKIFVEQMEKCVSRSTYKVWPKITGTLSTAQFQIITGEKSPEEVCSILKEKIE